MDRDLDTERLADKLAALAAADRGLSRRTLFRGAAGAAGTFAFLIAPLAYSKPTLAKAAKGASTRAIVPHSLHPDCNQGVGNGPEACDPGNSNQGDPSRSNDEVGGTPGNPGRKGGNGK